MQLPLFFSSQWVVTEHFKNLPIGQITATLHRVFSLEGELITDDSISTMTRIEHQGKSYFVKRYTAGGKHLRKYIGRSRIRAEWENMRTFERLGIPCPRVIAYGEDIKWGIMERGALVTENFPNSFDLSQLANEHSPLFKNAEWLNNVILQVADATRKMHEARFIHTDLKWRNILVTPSIPPSVAFIDCPKGEKVLLNLQRGIIKDLACLDKRAKYILSKTQRLKFYKLYKQCSNLNKLHKSEIKKILKFFEGRE